MRAALAITLLAFVASAANADDTAAPPPTLAGTGVVPAVKAGPVHAKLTGTLRPTLGVVYRGDARDRERWDYGIDGSRLDLGADIDAGGGVSALAYVKLATEQDADGSTSGSIDLERALVRWRPIPALQLSVGRDRVPLSAQSATPTSARLFPNRIALDQTFVLPADVGAQVVVAMPYVTVLGGVWNGVAGDSLLGTTDDVRGILYSARVEVTPLGALPFDESARPAGLRVALGVASTYRASTAYDAAGSAGLHTRDLRAAASLRMAWRGAYVEGEVLRRQRTDDLSSRPDVATGGYLQASYRFPIKTVDLAPLVRAGLESVRQLSAPARGTSLEIGAAAFPLARSSDRLLVVVLYARDHDPDLGSAQRGAIQIRLGF